MSAIGRFFSSRWGVILTGASVGVLAPIMVKLGNPGNMGICVACFSRDISGALGLHRAAAVQYIRPEIIGLVLGSLIAALAFREFKPRTGSSPLVRFVLGMLAMIGALVFLGCPWRAFLRLSGGDWNAILGILGFAAGIALGIVFFRMGFSLGRNYPAPRALGWVMPLLMIGLFLLLLAAPQFGRDATGNPTGPIFASVKGPGSQHALLWISLGVGLLIGFLAQRAAIVSFTASGYRVSDIGLLLDEEFEILCRVGLHCSPAAHRTIGTFPEGTVRFAPGLGTTMDEAHAAVNAVSRILSRNRSTKES